MRRAIGIGITAFLAWSCNQQPTVAVGRMAMPDANVDASGDAGHAAYDCTVPSILGPGGYGWCPYAEKTASSDWAAEPSPDAVSFRATSPVEQRAGIAFQFKPDGSFVDLSDFATVTLGVDITEGDAFELFLGQGPELGCSYTFNQKSSAGVYSTGLASPSWCAPTQCGFELMASGGMILAPVPIVSTLAATVRSLTFEKGSVRAGAARAFTSGWGPGGFCWFLVGWKSGTSGWASGPVTSSSAYVRATAKGDAVAGVAFELPSGFGLSQYRRLIVTANVAQDSRTPTFLIQGVRQESGRVWRFAPQGGSANYDVVLSQEESHFPAGAAAIGLDQIQRFEIVTAGGGDSYLDANVTAVTFVK